MPTRCRLNASYGHLNAIDCYLSAQALGGVCFSLAAWTEAAHNAAATPRERVWWLCLYYLLGSLLFLLAVRT